MERQRERVRQRERERERERERDPCMIFRVIWETGSTGEVIV
jgi:hypothetical protein